MAGKIACPEICLNIGVMGSDDKDERRSPKHKLQRTIDDRQIQSEDAETEFI